MLIQRLMYRNHHLLACRICDHLRLPKDGVLLHWATVKVFFY
jgi:hypothetical protein